MIHSYVPTLEKPRADSNNWYRNFHTSFYMSQLVNNIFLSYMDSFIGTVALEGIIQEKKIELEKSGALKKNEKYGFNIINKPEVYSYDVELGLHELILRFKETAKKNEHLFMCMGVDTGGYLSREVDVALDDLKESVDIDHWYSIVKGFLNIWELLFLFSAAESTLKEIINDYEYNTSDLIGKILKTEKKIVDSMSEKNMNKEFMLAIWDLFCNIRNIYSHTHGIISIKNKQALIKKASRFKCSYEGAFHEDILMSQFSIKTNEIFKFENLSIDKYYLISDEDLNIFRNFLSEFMFSLDRIIVRNESL